MNCKIHFKFLLALLMFVLFIIAKAQEKSPKLLSKQSLNEIIRDQPDYVIIDVRKSQDFLQGHIPGALNIWRPDIIDSSKEYGGLMASREAVEKLLSSLGVTSEDLIVIYDNNGGVDAARFWWILTTYGHSFTFLLDGGFNNWNDSYEEISTEIIIPKGSNYKFLNKQNDNRFANLEDVKKAINNKNTILLDVRTYDEYIGKIQKEGAYRKGRIPTSIHLDWANSVDYDGDKKFKTIEELKLIFESNGISKNKNIIAYCQSGVRSAHTTFVLSQLLGYKNVKNYDGSWIEWSYNRELPIDSGEVISDSKVNIESKVSYLDLFVNSFSGYGNYLWSEITFQINPWYQNYFWWLIVLSILVWVLEILFPWRKNQPIVRTDFWIDAFYMFFNFFIFNLVIFIAFSNVTTQFFKDIFGGDLSKFSLIDLRNFPEWGQLVIFFMATDFIQWFTHVMLHRFSFLWQFHKVHHSVEEMGFSAHLRYHWMENVFYTPMKYIVVMLIGGFAPEQAFIVYYIAIAIGHINHANIGISYGPLKYILNNPKMHIWHHYHEMPESHSHGVNFGISLSIWDYIFRTNYIPYSGRDIKLGFEKIENFPKSFFHQLFYGFKNGKD